MTAWAVGVLVGVLVALMATDASPPPCPTEPPVIREDDAGWLPALYGNGQGRLNHFDTPFVSLKP